MLHFGLIGCLIILVLTMGDDKPVCVVKRFRKSPPEPPISVQPCEMQQSQSVASPSVRRVASRTTEAVESDSWSVISPVDLFGADLDAESVVLQLLIILNHVGIPGVNMILDTNLEIL